MVRSGEDSDATIVVTSGIDQKARLVLVDPAPDGLGSTFEIYNGMCIAPGVHPSCMGYAFLVRPMHDSSCTPCAFYACFLMHSSCIQCIAFYASNA